MDMQGEVKQSGRVLRILAKVLRWGFIIGLLLMIGWMMLRGHYQKGTPLMKQYYFTEETASLYREGGLTVKRLLSYNDSTLGRAFYIDNVHFTEENSQFQFMLRYNKYNSAVSSIILDQGLHSFTFVLKDDKGNVYTDYEYITDSRMMYGYYRLSFAHVDLTEATELSVYVFADTGAPVSFDKAINSCVVWYSDGYQEDYDLTRAEMKRPKPVEGLMTGSVTVAGTDGNPET